MAILIKDLKMKELDTTGEAKNIGWMLLAPGYCTLDDKKKFRVNVWMVRDDWQDNWPPFFNSERKVDQGRKWYIKKYLRPRDISSQQLCMVVSGFIFSKGNRCLRQNDFEAAISKKLNIDPSKISNGILRDIAKWRILKDTPFDETFNNLPCYEIPFEDSKGKGIAIMPHFEVARHYFLKSAELTEYILAGNFDELYLTVSGILKDDATNERIAVLKINEGMTENEIKVLARIATDHQTFRAAKLIGSSLKLAGRTERTNNRVDYVRTEFPSKTAFNAGCTGFYLDPPHNRVFFVNQIHITDEELPFDRVVWEPMVDHRSKEQEDGEERKEKEYSNTKGVPGRPTGEDQTITSESGKAPRSQPKELAYEIGCLPFDITPQNTEVIELPKMDQHYNYTGTTTYFTTDGDNFTTEASSETGSTISGALLHAQHEHDKYWTSLGFGYIHSTIDELRKEIKLEGKNIPSLQVDYFDLADRSFKQESTIVNNGWPMFVVLRLRTANGHHFYLFEGLRYPRDKPHYMAMFYGFRFQEFEIFMVEEILEVTGENNIDWHAYGNNIEESDRDWGVKRFTHNENNNHVAGAIKIKGHIWELTKNLGKNSLPSP